jgi:hypothetical protein
VILTLVIYILTDKNPHILCCWTPSRRDAIYDGLPLSAQNSIVLSANHMKNKRNTYHHNDDASEEDL